MCLGERLYNHTDGAQLWYRPLANKDMAVILFNSDNFHELTMSVSWTELGWNADDEVAVRCLWGKKDLGVFKSSYTAENIPVHDVRFLRLSRQSPSL